MLQPSFQTSTDEESAREGRATPSKQNGRRSTEADASITGQVYMRTIELYSRLKTRDFLYPGYLYGEFSQQVAAETSRFQARKCVPSMTLITVDDTAALSRKSYNNAEECIKDITNPPLSSTPRSQILFFNGYMDPWSIAPFAALCQTEPAYFQSHLRFLCNDSFYSIPALPSTADNVIRVKFVTIGSRETRAAGLSKQARVDNLRKDGHDRMGEYRHRLALKEIALGQSVVRGYAVIDEKHFLIEQELSITLNYHDGQSLIFVWSDAGEDLCNSLQGPWLFDKSNRPEAPTRLLPTIQHKARVALRSHKFQSSEEGAWIFSHPQTAQRLPQDCGKLLNPQIMANDPFYALTDIFQFVCYSESAFLNLMEDLIVSDTNYTSLQKEKPTLSNLLYCQELTREHLPILKATLEVFKSRCGQRWRQVATRNQPDLEEKANAAAQLLVSDMEHLVRRTEELLQRCSRGMDVIMNNVMLAESRRAVSQAEGVAKLTLVAFFFIPLSFTTSFFGMNFKELGKDDLSIWVWFIVSVPLILISIAGLFINFRNIPSLKLG